MKPRQPFSILAKTVPIPADKPQDGSENNHASLAEAFIFAI